MSFFDLIKRSGRSLRSAKLRTLLTALAIAVGGFTLSLTLAAGNGVRDYTTKLVSSNFDPAELIVGRDPEIANDSAPSDRPQEFDSTVTSFQNPGGNGNFQLKQVSRSDITSIKNNPRVEQVREQFNLNIRYITRDNQKQFTGSAQAYNPGQKPEIVAGSLPDNGDIALGELLLPDTYIEALGFTSAEEALGQEVVVVSQEPFSIASLTRATEEAQISQSTALADIDINQLTPSDREDKFVVRAVTRKPATSLSFGVSPLLISSQDARSIYEFTASGDANFDQFLFVNVRVTDGENKTIRDEVKAELEAQGFYVQSSEDIQKTITQFVDILQGVVAALGAVTLVASIFGIVNTQYISVLERTREIGLIKALGMSRRKVLTLFIFEAMWIGFIGGIIGIAGAFILGTLINPFITEQLSLGDGNSLIIFEISQMLLLLFALMYVAAVAGLLPARKAAKLDPVEALRAE